MICNDAEEKVVLVRQRQHIAAIIFMFMKTIKELIFAFGVGIIIALREAIHYVYYVGGAFFLIVLVISILRWMRFTYRVEENELRVESGIFVRKKKYVPINRIHTIDFSANLIHRMFTLVKVNIDTASGGTSELHLSAITRKNGDALREALGKNNENRIEVEGASDLSLPTRKISWKRLIVAGSTTNGIGALLFAVYLGGSQLLQFVPDNIYDDTIIWFSKAGMIVIILLAILALLILYMLSITGTVVKYAFFSIEKHSDHLFIKRGLIETKELTIPFERIQSISMKQNFLRQFFGLTTIHATVVGDVFKGAESAHPILFPLMRKKEVAAFLETFTPAYVIDEKEWIPLAKKAWIYYIGFPLFIPIIATMLIGYFFLSYIWIPLIITCLLALLGTMAYRYGGFQMDDHKIIFRKRFITNERRIMLKKRIQALKKSQHKLQQMQGVSSVQLTVFGGLAGETWQGAHFDDGDVNEIGDWYMKRAKPNSYDKILPGK